MNSMDQVRKELAELRRIVRGIPSRWAGGGGAAPAADPTRYYEIGRGNLLATYGTGGTLKMLGIRKASPLLTTVPAAVCKQGVDTVTITAGGTGYTSPPTVTFGGGGSGAIGRAFIQGGAVVAVAVLSRGSGYASPTVSFSGGGGSSAAATATSGWFPDIATAQDETYPAGIGWAYDLDPLTLTRAGVITAIAVSSGGSGYTVAPTVVINGGTGSGVSAVAVLSGGAVSRIDISNGGSGWSGAAGVAELPTVTLEGGDGTGATAGSVTIEAVESCSFVTNLAVPFPEGTVAVSTWRQTLAKSDNALVLFQVARLARAA